MEFVRYEWDHKQKDEHVNLLSERARRLPFFLHSMADWYEGPRYYTKRENCSNYYLLYTVSGKGIVEYRSKKVLLEPGQICFINCIEPHYYATHNCDVWHNIWFHINGSSANCYFELINGQNDFCPVTLEDTDEIYNVYKMLLNNINKKDISDELSIVNILTVLFNHIVIQWHKQHLINEEPVPMWLIDAVFYIDHRLHTEITINQIAKDFHVTPYEIERAFKYYKKQSPAEYIQSKREDYNKKNEAFTKCQHPKWVFEAIIYIEENFSNKISLKQLMDSCHVSKPVFVQKFKQYTCMSPIEYIGYLRLNKALKDLDNSDDSISNIAIDSGFPSSSVFSQKFKEWMGITPREYRNRN